MKKTAEFNNTWYDEKNQILTEVSFPVDPETGEISDVANIKKTYFGDGGWCKMYAMQFLEVLGKFNINLLNVMCFIWENTSTGNNIFLGTVETISKYCKISRSTTIRCLNELKEAGFLKMVARGQYMLNPKIMYVGGGEKNPGKRGFLVELYEGTRTPAEEKTHKRYKTKSIKKNIDKGAEK